MTDFTITITDPDQLVGITAARELYNADPNNEPLATDAEYVQRVMSGAAASYAQQHVAKVKAIREAFASGGIDAVVEAVAPRPVRPEPKR